MRVEETKTEYKTVHMVIITCDLCGTENKNRYSGIKRCQICGKDVCSDCSEQVDIDCNLNTPHNYSDYPSYICKPCWKKGKEFRKKIMIVRDRAEKYEEELWKEWKIAID